MKKNCIFLNKEIRNFKRFLAIDIIMRFWQHQIAYIKYSFLLKTELLKPKNKEK